LLRTGKRMTEVAPLVGFEYRTIPEVARARPGARSIRWSGAGLGRESHTAGRGARAHNGAVAVVLDNAPGHRKVVPRAAAPPLVPLPPYSPDLEGEVYATTTRERAERELAANPDRLRSLTAWPWLVEQVTAARAKLAPSELHERL
jgi:hypothetical protein